MTGSPPAGQGDAITHGSNTVVVYLAGIHTVAVAPAGAGALTQLTLNNVSQVQVNVYGPGGATTASAAVKRQARVLYGSIVRKNAVGHVKITVKLNKAGRQWLARHHRMTVTVEVRVTPKPRQAAGHAQDGDPEGLGMPACAVLSACSGGNCTPRPGDRSGRFNSTPGEGSIRPRLLPRRRP